MLQTPDLDLSSFKQDFTAAIIGASGGIGGAIVSALVQDPRCARVYAFSRNGQTGAQGSSLKLMQARMDTTDANSIEAGFSVCDQKIDLIINATGILHAGDIAPEKSWRQLDADAFAEVLRVNTIAPAMIARTALERLPADRKGVFAALSARVGSISDNRLGGWHAYRASKAALNMLIRNFALELARKSPNALAVGLHPGTVDTQLSKPFQGNVKANKLFTPEFSAASLLNVVNGLTPEQSGGVYAWDGQEIPA